MIAQEKEYWGQKLGEEVEQWSQLLPLGNY